MKNTKPMNTYLLTASLQRWYCSHTQVFCTSLSMNEAAEYSWFKSHLYILFCEVPVTILCPFCGFYLINF